VSPLAVKSNDSSDSIYSKIEETSPCSGSWPDASILSKMPHPTSSKWRSVLPTGNEGAARSGFEGDTAVDDGKGGGSSPSASFEACNGVACGMVGCGDDDDDDGCGGGA